MANKSERIGLHGNCQTDFVIIMHNMGSTYKNSFWKDWMNTRKCCLFVKNKQKNPLSIQGYRIGHKYLEKAEVAMVENT